MIRLQNPIRLILGLAVAAGACSPPTFPDDIHAGLPAWTIPSDESGQAVPGQYIIVFNDDVADVLGLAQELVEAHGGTLLHVYQHALAGFAAQLPPAAAEILQHHPQVASVEPDRVVVAFAQSMPTGIRRSFAAQNTSIGLDGVDQRVDVDVAIIDTGIDLDHPDLNVVQSTNCTGGSPWSGSCKDAGEDDNGHGTHVAGTVGALDNGVGVVGVAPGARLHAVKVLRSDGSGYMSWIVAGVDWVTARAGTIEVANMSLGCKCSSSALNDAISRSVRAGVVYAVAAGNSDSDVRDYIPANHPDVITVSALSDFDGVPGGLGNPTCRSDEDDTLANFSNFGSGVEVAAPGVCILSTYVGGGTATLSGTSMASPHVAGAAALLASGSNSPANKTDVDRIIQTIRGEGNVGWNDESGDGSKEPLLDVGDASVFAPIMTSSSGGGGGVTNQPPTASWSHGCSGLSCDFNGTGSSDSDGSIQRWEWDFNGDGVTDATGATAQHTFPSAGTWRVTLTVEDDDGARGASSRDVSVSAPTAGVVVSRIDLRVEARGPNRQAVASVYAPSGSVITADFRLNGAFLNQASDSVGGRGYASLSSNKVQGVSGSATFSITVLGASGVTTCSVSVAQGTASCR